MIGNYADDSDPRFVYTFWTEDGRCLYVGCTVDFARRLAAHRRERPWWDEIARIEVDVHPDFASGYAVETERIKALDPIHNSVYTTHATPRREPTPEQRKRTSENISRGHAWRRRWLAEQAAAAEESA